MPTRIALLAADANDRNDLHGYLHALGFTPAPCDELSAAGTDLAVVCIRDRADLHLLAGLATYCKRSSHRVVVISRWPALVRALAMAHLDRLEILVPPLLLGQLADALRGDP